MTHHDMPVLCQVGLEQASLKQLLHGFRLIWASPYLRLISLFFMLSSCVSSFMYFERSLVVAAASSAASSRWTPCS